MKTRKLTRGLLHRLFCLLLSVIVLTTSLPFSSNATAAAQEVTTQKKWIKAEPEVFAPLAKEQTNFSFNLEGKKKAVNISIKEGTRVIATLVTNKEYEGKYTVHQISWDGKDDNGNYVKNGTYKVVVEPVGKYKKYKSIASVCVVGDKTKPMNLAANRSDPTVKVYGSGGTKQGIRNVTISVKKDGTNVGKSKAVVGENVWYANLPMASYHLYEVT